MRIFRSQLTEWVRAILAALVVLALILPSVAQALPKPALSPEQALLRDLASSLCSQNGGSGKGNQDLPGQGHHDCQLCVLCCTSPTAQKAVGVEQVEAELTFVLARFSSSWSVPVVHPLGDETGPPRGPPIFS